MEKTINQNNNGDVNPFAKTSKLMRSPILRRETPTGDRSPVPMDETTVDVVTHTESLTGFQKLGAHINHLVEMMADGKEKNRRSINQEMRDTIRSIEEQYELAARQLNDAGAAEVQKNHTASQTSPLMRPTVSAKRRQGDGEETPSSKRFHETPRGTAKAPSRSNRAKPTPKRAKEAGAPKGKKPEKWQTVTRKKTGDARKARQRPIKPRPDAIVIRTEDKGDDTYANILRKVRTDPALKAIADSVTGVRRTQKGDLLLQLKESGDKATEITNNIGVALGQTATVKTLSRRTAFDIRDIDEVTTKEEICEALNGLLDSEGVVPSDVVSLRKAFMGMQTATINLPANTAKSLLDVGKVKIGWSVCRLKERTMLTKCFKCLEFGHISKQCRNKEDRSKRCRNCGEEGHIAKDCKKPASCMFCMKDNPQQADHVAGSNRCPVFRRALSQKAR